MIPLDNAVVILPRMPNASTATDEFPLTIIKPPVVDVKCYRLLRSRPRRRNSSASPVRSLLAIKTECEKYSPELDDVLDAKEVSCPQLTDSVFLSRTELNTCLLSNVRVKCTDKLQYSARKNVVSSAKRDEGLVTEGPSVIIASTLSPCETLDAEKSLHLLEDSSSTETKGKVVCVSPVWLTKRAHRKSTRLKKTAKKKVNSLKRRKGAGEIFARLVHSHGKKNLSGPACCSKEQEQQNVRPSLSNDSEANYLNIQKVCDAYAPKKNRNKGSGILLPKVYKRSLRKEASALSPSKWDGLKNGSYVVPVLSSPCKELDINTATRDDKMKKIYLSETHSGMMKGVPCVPPCTPTVDQLKNVEYILSLTDVKSQRAVKAKLSSLENKIKTEDQRRKEKAIKEEQKRTYGAILQLKQRQRAEIYALNKVMTCLENENFRKFMEQTSVDTLPV